MRNETESLSHYEEALEDAINTVRRFEFSGDRQRPVLGPAILASMAEIANDAQPLLMALISHVDADARDATQLRHHTSALVALFEKVDRLPIIRPWIFVVRRLHHLIRLIQTLTLYVLQFQSCSEVDERERLLARIEAAISKLNAESEAFGASLEGWGRLVSATHPEDLIGTMASSVGVLRGATGEEMGEQLLNHEQRANEYSRELTGESGPCHSELGVFLLLAKDQVELIGDLDNFENLVKKSYNYMRGRREKAEPVIHDESWLKDLSTALAISYFDGDTASAVIAATRTEQGLLGGLLNLGKDVIEAWSRTPVATLLALRSKDLQHWQRRDAGAALQAASQGDTADLVIGLPIAIRNAAAHHAWRLSGQTIEFRDNTGAVRTTMEWPELVDSLLAGVENYLALVAGLCLGAANMGASMEPLSGAAMEHLPYRVLIRSTSTFAGYPDIEIEELDDHIEFFIPDFPMDVRMLGIAGSFAMLVPDRIASLSIKNSDGPDYRSDTFLLREWMREKRQPQRNVIFFSILGDAQINGRFLIPHDDYEVYVARALSNALGENSLAEIESVSDLIVPTLKRRSMKLYRAFAALLGQPAKAAPGRSGRSDSEALLAWLKRRSELPMPKIPGWQ